MIPKVYNYPSNLRGDTIGAKQFTIRNRITKEPKDLTNAVIRSHWITVGAPAVEKEIGDGITIFNAEEGTFKLDKFKLEKPGVWRYDIEIEFPDEEVLTYITGKIKIIDDVTK